MQLYEGTTALDTLAIDPHWLYVGNGALQIEYKFPTWPRPVLVGGQTYRIGLKHTDGYGLTIYRVLLSNDADNEALFGGLNFWTSSREQTGGWTDILTERLIIDLIIDGIELPAAALTGSPMVG